MTYIYKTQENTLSFYDEIANANADHSKETLLASYTPEEYSTLDQPIRLIDGKLTFGRTQEEIDTENKFREISELKSYLSSTDYVVIKISEGVATKEEYADILEKRVAARKKINELEENN